MNKNEVEKLLGVEIEIKDGKFYYGDSLDLRGTGITALPENLTVGGSLDLEGTGITALPENLTVGGSLYLRGTGITALPENLTVGGSLYLRGTGITALPENLTVGGSLYLRGTGITDTSKVKRNINEESFFQWRNNKYIKADGIFSKVISHKRNVFKIQKIGQSKESYLVTDGNGKFSHGNTVKEAKEDLIFKISNRDKSDYKELTLESKMSFEKAIECYRIITGACSFGTKDFVSNRLIKKQKEYTVAEMIEITKGEYGSESFKKFFVK